MADKGGAKEQFISSATSESAFLDLVKFKGLAVVDVYSNWCGPCKAIVPTFKKLSFDYSERPVRFLTAEADSIPCLFQHAKKSQPVIQVYKDGDLVETIQGVNAPRLLTVVAQNLPDGDSKDDVIEEQNEQEKKDLAEEEALFTSKPLGDEQSNEVEFLPQDKMVVTASMVPTRNEPANEHGSVGHLDSQTQEEGNGKDDEGSEGNEGQTDGEENAGPVSPGRDEPRPST